MFEKNYGLFKLYRFIGGHAESRACVTEALMAALACFEELGRTDIPLHVILLCCSPPYSANAGGVVPPGKWILIFFMKVVLFCYSCYGILYIILYSNSNAIYFYLFNFNFNANSKSYINEYNVTKNLAYCRSWRIIHIFMSKLIGNILIIYFKDKMLRLF